MATNKMHSRQRWKVLTNQIDLQRQKIDEARNAVETAEQKYGKTADTTNELRLQYEKMQRQLNGMEQDLKDTTTGNCITRNRP